MSVTYGTRVALSPYRRTRELIAEPQRAPAGNLVLRVGQEVESHGWWEKIGHVVMLPDEAEEFARAILKAIGREA